MNASAGFPRLTDRNHRITSPANPDYNCTGWAAGDTAHWWQPGVHWPVKAEREAFGIDALKAAFAALGFVECPNDILDNSFEKVALYATTVFYTHAARQLANGKWTSKLGREEDIEHENPEDVAGGVYGEVAVVMKHPIRESLP